MDLKKIYLEAIGIDYLPMQIMNSSVETSAGHARDNQTELSSFRAEIGDCQRCDLARSRTKLVFGAGTSDARLLFVGEAPGQEEDLQGEPFVGKAGQLLTRIIRAMGLARDQVFICNVLKCRPPGNRDPLPGEVETCKPFLLKQLEIIKPEVICALGSFATKTLIGPDVMITRVRGVFHDFNGIPLMPTFHPSYLLRNPAAKKEVWEDVQKIMKRLDLPDGAAGG
jgi:DNA polymerase